MRFGIVESLGPNGRMMRLHFKANSFSWRSIGLDEFCRWITEWNLAISVDGQEGTR